MRVVWRKVEKQSYSNWYFYLLFVMLTHGVMDVCVKERDSLYTLTLYGEIMLDFEKCCRSTLQD